MTDINTILTKAYFDAISTAISPTKCFEQEEPDNLTDPVYVVISEVTSQDNSTKNSNDLNAQITVQIHSWKLKYNNSDDLNTVAGQILEAIKPTPLSVLDLGADVQMTNLRIANDVTQRLGELAGRKFISRIITFEQKLYIKN